MKLEGIYPLYIEFTVILRLEKAEISGQISKLSSVIFYRKTHVMYS